MKNKNKKGFTLIELIIVMAILGIFLTSVMNLVIPTKVISENTNKYQAEQATINTMTKFIQEKTRYAEDVIILDNCADYPIVAAGSEYLDYYVIEIDNSTWTYKNRTVSGRIYYKDKLSETDRTYLLDEAFYADYIYDIDVTKESTVYLKTDISTILVDINNVPTQRLKSSSTIRLRNMERLPKSIHYIDLASGSPALPLGLSASSGTNTYILIKVGTQF